MKDPGTFRIEETANGRKLVTICNGAHIWLLSPKDKKGVHRRRTPEEVSAVGGRLRIIGDDLPGIRKSGARRKGSESVTGVVCDVYELKKDGLTHRFWVARGPDRLTMKRQSIGASTFATRPGEAMKKHTIRREMTYSWKTGVPMPASLFQVPKGYSIQETQAPRPPVFAPPRGQRR